PPTAGTTPGMRGASRTACRPSTRKRSARSRPRRLVSRRNERSAPTGRSGTAFGSVGRFTSGSSSFGLVVLGDDHESLEGGDVVDGELGEHLAVNLDAGVLQAVHEAVVGHALGAGRGVDALDPQAAEVALLGATVAVGVGHRVEDLLLGLAVQAGTLAP